LRDGSQVEETICSGQRFDWKSENKQHAKSDRRYAAGADDKANTSTGHTDCAMKSHLAKTFIIPAIFLSN
jgi:hypothetical protein